MTDRLCEHPGCEKPHCARGLCNAHYKQVKMHGAVSRLGGAAALAAHREATTPLPGEGWSPVAGAPDYEVSTLGRVRSWARGGAACNMPVPRLISQRPDRGGYLRAVVRMHGRPRSRFVHHLVLESFVGPCPYRKRETRHLNGVRDDNRLGNLAWGTSKQNAMDRVRHGTDARGERAPSARLTEADVLWIRATRREGHSYPEIAHRLGVSASCVQRAALGITWSHLPGAAAPATPEDRRRGSTTLTPDRVLRMREMRRSGATLGAVARAFGVSESTAARVVTGQTHRDCPGLPDQCAEASP